jgi:hypothetical protein
VILALNAGRVAWVAAGHQPPVHDDLLVHPGAAGVSDVGRQARPRRDRAAVDDLRLHQHPGGVADGTDGPSGRDEVTDELHGVGVQPQRIGVGAATRQDESVVFVDRRIGDGDGDVERLGPVEVVERLGLPGLRGQQPGGRAGLGHGLPGFGLLDLLDALARDEEGDGLSVEIMCHWNAALLLD